MLLRVNQRRIRLESSLRRRGIQRTLLRNVAKLSRPRVWCIRVEPLSSVLQAPTGVQPQSIPKDMVIATGLHPLINVAAMRTMILKRRAMVGMVRNVTVPCAKNQGLDQCDDDVEFLHLSVGR